MRLGTSYSRSYVLARVQRELAKLTCDSYSFIQETDKATIDVEAQDDGVLGKILVRRIPQTLL